MENQNEKRIANITKHINILLLGIWLIFGIYKLVYGHITTADFICVWMLLILNYIIDIVDVPDEKGGN